MGSNNESMGPLEGALEPYAAPLHAFVHLEEGQEIDVPTRPICSNLAHWPTASAESWQEQRATSLAVGKHFWSKSGVP
jgi:hypothetical protein